MTTHIITCMSLPLLCGYDHRHNSSALPVYRVQACAVPRLEPQILTKASAQSTQCEFDQFTTDY
jgi:hypothetical protein